MGFDARACLIALPIALLGAWNAWAGEFAVVHANPDEITVMDSLMTDMTGTGFRRAWTVSIQKTLGVGGPPQPGYIRTLNEYDCRERRMRWLSLSIFSRFGRQLVTEDNPSHDWKPAPQLGQTDEGLGIVCDGVNAQGVVAAPSVGKLVIGLMQTWDEATPLPPLQAPHSAGPPLKVKRTLHGRARLAARKP